MPETEVSPSPSDLEDDEANISAEEKKEILAQIESVVSENRISINEDVLKIKPLKQGILFPILINAIAFVAIAVGIFAFYIIFLNSGQQIEIDTKTYTSDQYKLIIDDMRKNAEELKAKENEIAKIQGELSKIDEERDKLLTSMDEEINTRREELEKAMAIELNNQRALLKQQDLSDEDIEARIASLKQQKEIEYSSEIEAIKKQAEENEEILKQARDKYTQDLEKFNDEKLALAEEVKRLEKKEMESRKQQEEATKDLEAAKTEAERQLAAMAKQREKEELINGQILGSYSRIQTDIQEENYSEAMKNLTEMRNFFNDDEITTLPSVMKRRNVELFIIGSLEKLIDTESSQAVVDSASLIEKTGLITSISEKFQTAETFYQQRKYDEAQKLYQETLDIIPEIRNSYDRLTAYSMQVKSTDFNRFMSQGDASYKEKDYNSAIDYYTRALKAFPESQNSVDKMVGRIIEAGYAVQGGDAGRKEDEDVAASRLIMQAGMQSSNHLYVDAINSYMEILIKYPRSGKIEDARTGINNTMKLVNNQLSSQKDTAVGDLNAQMAEKDEKIDQLSTALSQKETEMSGMGNMLLSRNAEIENYKAVEQELTEKISKLETELAKAKNRAGNSGTNNYQGSNEDIALLNKELENYDNLKDEIDLIKRKYLEYAKKEDNLLKSRGPVAYLSTKTYLGEILSSPFVKKIFPDLYDRIKKFDEATYLDAREDGKYLAIDGVLSIIDNRMALPRSASPKKYWDDLKKENKDNTILLDLIRELEDIIDK
ncbi:MAG: hypothetical protein JW969_06175 [Spirochaetales bacterium]|nr:hypothetical protein [Spirochaetales bacterium]